MHLILTYLKRFITTNKTVSVNLYLSAILAIALSIFAILTAILAGDVVNNAIRKNDPDKLLQLSLMMLAVLLGQVISQLGFNYYANWLGQSVIKDVRIALFKNDGISNAVFR